MVYRVNIHTVFPECVLFLRLKIYMRADFLYIQITDYKEVYHSYNFVFLENTGFVVYLANVGGHLWQAARSHLHFTSPCVGVVAFYLNMLDLLLDFYSLYFKTVREGFSSVYCG
jgi:hypothetical protein